MIKKDYLATLMVNFNNWKVCWILLEFLLFFKYIFICENVCKILLSSFKSLSIFFFKTLFMSSIKIAVILALNWIKYIESTSNNCQYQFYIFKGTFTVYSKYFFRFVKNGVLFRNKKTQVQLLYLLK